MAGLDDTHTTEIHSQDIEGRVCRSLEDTAQTPDERVSAIGGHRIDHHTTSTTTREGFHQCRWQGTHEVAVGTCGLHAPADTVYKHIHCARGTEHADAYKDSHEVGDDAYCRRKTVFRTLDEGVIHIYFLSHTCDDESDDNHHQHDIGRRGTHLVHQDGIHLSEAPDDACHDGSGTAQRQQHGTVQQIDLLIEAGDDDAGEGREEGRQQDRDKDIRRLGGSHLGAVHHDGDRNQRQARGVQHEEHDHRVRGRIFLRVQFLQLFHRLQAERCCRIVEAQHVGSDIHEDGTRHGVSLGDIREQLHEDRTQHACQHIHDTALLANLHDTEPERQHACQSE